MKGMNMTDVEDIKLEEHDHPMKHRLGEKGMNIVKKYYHSTKHQLKVDDMNTVDIYMEEVGV
jgi:hypothetical protein